MGVIYVTSKKKKPLSLSCPVRGNYNHYMSINQYMIDKKIPHEVPDVPFYHDKISQGLLALDNSNKAASKWKKYYDKKVSTTEEAQKRYAEDREKKLQRLRNEQEERARLRGRRVSPAVKPNNEDTSENLEVNEDTSENDNEDTSENLEVQE